MRTIATVGFCLASAMTSTATQHGMITLDDGGTQSDFEVRDSSCVATGRYEYLYVKAWSEGSLEIDDDEQLLRVFVRRPVPSSVPGAEDGTADVEGYVELQGMGPSYSTGSVVTGSVMCNGATSRLRLEFSLRRQWKGGGTGGERAGGITMAVDRARLNRRVAEELKATVKRIPALKEWVSDMKKEAEGRARVWCDE